MQTKFEPLEKFIQLSEAESKKFIGGLLDTTKTINTTTVQNTAYMTGPNHPDSQVDSNPDSFVVPDSQ